MCIYIYIYIYVYVYIKQLSMGNTNQVILNLRQQFIGVNLGTINFISIA